MKTIHLVPLCIALACVSLASCASKPKAIPEDLSAQVLVQRAQEASDRYDYDVALSYYAALRDRFGSDPAYLCAAEYETAFIAYKQGHISAAKAGLEALLARYQAAEGANLPQHYRILATKVLENIAAQENPKKK